MGQPPIRHRVQALPQQSSSRFKHEGDGAVIDETDLHVRTEATGLHIEPFAFAKRRDKFQIEVFGLSRRRGNGKTRTVTPGRVRHQRELGNDQHPTFRIAHIQIHTPFVIREHAPGKQPPGKLFRRVLVITRSHAQQHQHARADSADHLIIHGDGSLRHSLHKCSHSGSLLLWPVAALCGYSAGMTIRPTAYLLLLFAQLALVGCTPPTPAEEGVREALRKLAIAVEEREAGDVMGALHEEFRNMGHGGPMDRKDARRLVMAVFYRHQNISVNLANVRVEPDGMNQDRVVARFNALVTGGRGGVIPEEARLYRVESVWQRQNGEWKLLVLEGRRMLDR